MQSTAKSFAILGLKLYFSDKNACYWHRNRCVDQCDRTGGQETNPRSNSHLTSYNILKRKCTPFSYWCQENRVSTNQRIKGHPSFSPGTHINYKRTEDLHIMPLNWNYRKTQVKQSKIHGQKLWKLKPDWGKQVIENVHLKSIYLPVTAFCILTI